MYITKRDGTYQEFSKMKIVDAVLAAFREVDGEETEYALIKAGNIADYIEDYADHSDRVLGIEEIQDLVEHGLSSTKRKDVAKAYILYREKRNKVREYKTSTNKIIREKLMASNVQNANANVDEFSFGGRQGEVSNEYLKQFALDNLVSETTRENHLNNEIYIHDLSSYALGDHNCLTCPIDKLLANGFKTRQVDIRPAGSINTAFQLLAVIFQIQSLQQFGGVSASHIDWSMVPYVRKSFAKHYIDGLYYCEIETKDLNDLMDKGKEYISNLSIASDELKNFERAYEYAMDMTERELNQAVEGMFHNLNSLQSRSGNQLPFSSINFGTCTLLEGRMVIKSILENSIKGVGPLHSTSIFPCTIFQLGNGINKKPEDPNYDLFQLALKSTAQRLYPNYVNMDWSGNEGYDPEDPSTYSSTMGCRTWSSADINAAPGTNPQKKDGRGNIAPTTIILPTLAMKAKEKIENLAKLSNSEISEYDLVEEFMELLDQKLYEAKDSLIERFDYICSQDATAAKFMWENNTMDGYIPEEGLRSAMKHGSLAIGMLGLAETLQILIECDHTEPEGMDLAKQIVGLYKERCAEFKKEYKLNFGVYYTPAENLCYTAMKQFKKKYGEISNVSDREFFTNSMHVPVWKEMSPFDKIDIESKLTGYSSAGCITYVELDGGVKNNLKALETIVLYAMDHDIPYFAINVPNDQCQECGYTDEMNDVCPECGSSNIKRLRRVTGYLSTDYSHFNPGKIQEVLARVKHA